MKVRVLAVVLAVASVGMSIQAAEAGPLTDALRNKAGQAKFLGNIVAGKLKDGVRKAVLFAWRHG